MKGSALTALACSAGLLLTLLPGQAFAAAPKPSIQTQETASAKIPAQPKQTEKPSTKKPAQTKPLGKPPIKPPAKAEKVIAFAKKQIGVRYVFGGTSPKGFDCSGFVFYVLSHNGYKIKRTNVAGYWKQATRVSQPKPGDLIFFQNTYKRGPSHMGIYLGNGNFIHASSSKDRVRIDNIKTSSYYKKHFLGYGKL